MVTTTEAFVHSVVRTFDAQQYSGVNLDPAADAGRDIGPGLVAPDIEGRLPKELSALIANFGATFEEWVHATGTLDASVHEPDTERAIEIAAKGKLEEFSRKKTEELKKWDEQIEEHQHKEKELEDALKTAPDDNRSALTEARDSLHSTIPSLIAAKNAVLAKWRPLDEAIASTKRSLENPIVTSSKHALLSFVFRMTFTQASHVEKERIITAAEQFKPTLEAAQSTAKRAMIRVATFISEVLTNRTFQLIAAVFLAYHMTAIYFAAKAAIQFFVTQTLGPTLISAIANNAPVIVIQATDLVIGGVTWVANHQWQIFFGYVGAEVTRHAAGFDRNSWVGRTLFTLGGIALLPTKIIWELFLMPLRVINLVCRVTFLGAHRAGSSLQGLANQSEASHLESEGEKAHALWLQLADQVADNRARLVG